MWAKNKQRISEKYTKQIANGRFKQNYSNINIKYKGSKYPK